MPAKKKKGPGSGGKRYKADGSSDHEFTPERAQAMAKARAESARVRKELKLAEMELVSSTIDKQLRELLGVHGCVQVVNKITSAKQMHREMQNAVWNVLTSNPATLDVWLRVMALNRPGLFTKMVDKFIPSSGKMPDEPEELGPKDIIGDAASEPLRDWLSRYTQGLGGQPRLPGSGGEGVRNQRNGEGEVVEGVCQESPSVDQHLPLDPRPPTGGDDPPVHNVPLPG